MQDREVTVSTRYGEPLTAGALESPAAERNKEPILAVLKRLLPPAGTILEIASGTGQHVMHFARALPQLTWQPTDPDADLLEAIRARQHAMPLDNVRQPLTLDVLATPWPIARADAILCINMIHVAPWSAAQALFAHSRQLLAHGSLLILYGPFKRGGRHTAASNESFDASLRQRNPEWGVRDLDDVTALAEHSGFELRELVQMPANNCVVVFQKAAG